MDDRADRRSGSHPQEPFVTARFCVNVTDLVERHANHGLAVAQRHLVETLLRIAPEKVALFAIERGQAVSVRAERIATTGAESRDRRPRRLARNTLFTLTSTDVIVSVGVDWKDDRLEVLRSMRTRFGSRLVLGCYDLIPLTHPHVMASDRERRNMREYFTRLIASADAIWSISEATASSLEHFARAEGLRTDLPIVVITLGDDHLAQREPSPRTRTSMWSAMNMAPRVLTVASLNPHKNHELLYHAMIELSGRGSGELPTLVVIGNYDPEGEQILRQMLHDPLLGRSIIYRANVSEQVLAMSYANAAFSVFPSFVEGWGFPIRESLTLGRPCIAADTPASREAGGSLVEYVSPWDPLELANKMSDYLDHPQKLAAAASEIRQSFRPKPWTDVAEKLLEVAGL